MLLCADIPVAHAGKSSPFSAPGTDGPAFCFGPIRKAPRVQEEAEWDVRA